MNDNRRIGPLDWLLKLLDIDLETLRRDDDEGFSLRLKVQKAAYLLKRMGVRPFTEFNFNLYLYGPYSPEVASIYYGKVEGPRMSPEVDEERLKVVRWFLNHDQKWMEIASSILILLEDYPDIRKEEILRILKRSKPRISDAEFKAVYKELERMRLIGEQTLLAS